MAGASETLTLDELGQWAADAGARMDGLTFEEPLSACIPLIRESTLENFRGQHAPDGTPWPPRAHDRPTSKGQDQVLRDKGILEAAATGDAQVELTGVSLTISNNLEYAAIHQYGGHIEPTKAKMLAIPLTVEAERAGSPRDFPDKLFIFRSKNDHVFLAAAKPARERKHRNNQEESEGDIVLHYILVPSVDIPARPFMGLNDELIEKIGLIFKEWLGKQVGES